MRDYLLLQIEKCKFVSIQEAMIIMSANGIYFRVRNATPNVIEYHQDNYDIIGKIIY
jgi:hypothetical protein